MANALEEMRNQSSVGVGSQEQISLASHELMPDAPSLCLCSSGEDLLQLGRASHSLP